MRTTTGMLLCVWWHWNIPYTSGQSARKREIFTVYEIVCVYCWKKTRK